MALTDAARDSILAAVLDPDERSAEPTTPCCDRCGKHLVERSNGYHLECMTCRYAVPAESVRR